jgi:hypothetical protein
MSGLVQHAVDDMVEIMEEEGSEMMTVVFI